MAAFNSLFPHFFTPKDSQFLLNSLVPRFSTTKAGASMRDVKK